ncbi:MAG: preprotein translocase subunit SecA [Pseudomonadota bacterium]
MFSFLKKLFGTSNDRIIKKLLQEIEQINSLEPSIQSLTDAELQAKTPEFQKRIAEGASLDDIAYEAFAVAREASKRVLGMRPFDVQLIGGLVMHRGMITEMRTGEGKTLVATLPAYLNALSGKGVHVVTTNDYLAKRDSEWMGSLYKFLGLTVGCIVSGISDEERKAAYNADITHATNNELGFDFLRDNMKFSRDQKSQRPFNYAIVDEVDSILIDEARTPLIISGPVDDQSDLYAKIDHLVRMLSSDDYEKDEKAKTVNLTEAGTNRIEELLIGSELIKPDTSLYDFENMSFVHYVNQALRAHIMFARDVDYMVKDGKVMIIDEFTGRIMDGRRYSEGLHQSLEAKEGVRIQNENQTLASVTFQNYFRMYSKLSGMTGTALTEAAELKDIYHVDVVSVPTHHPIQRIDHDDEIYGSKKDKYDAILKLISDCYDRGQPILVGTVSIEKSEEISEMLKKHKIPHNVLNAKFHENEAHIIAQAGRYKAVTIATNMAGRGTDIKLGGNPEMLLEEMESSGATAKPEDLLKKITVQVAEEKAKVIEAGGLFVIGTERHESRRIDNQLRGRSGRQGDPGATRFYLSLEDDLMRIFASDRISGLLRTLGLKDGEAIQHPMISRALEKAQQKVEAHNYEIRKNLLKFDDVMNDQRKVIYAQRNEIIDSEDTSEIRENMLEHVIEEMVLRHIPAGTYREDWDIPGLIKECHLLLDLEIHEDMIMTADVTEVEVIEKLIQMSNELHADKEKNFGEVMMRDASKYILLATLDQVWKDHLHYLDHLRQGISLRAYGQKDPLNEYKREAFGLFEAMLGNLRELFIQRISYLQIDASHLSPDAMSLQKRKLQQMYESRDDPAFAKYNAGSAVESTLRPVKAHVKPEDRIPSDPETWGKITRNEACPCNSGKKYKHCHGAD